VAANSFWYKFFKNYFYSFTQGFPCTAGTTATVAFIRNGKLYTGHVGDSSIILANFDEAAAGCNFG